MRVAAGSIMVVLVAAACVTTVAPPGATVPAGTPPAGTAPVAPPTTDPAGTVAPTEPAASPPGTTGIPGGSEVALLPDPAADGPRLFTLGDVATVEFVTSLEVLEAVKGHDTGFPLPDGQVAYAFLVRFTYDQASAAPLDPGSGYYNSIGFTMRDDEGFQYSSATNNSGARTPTLLFGDLAFGQQVQGWITVWGPPDTSFVELLYTPIADEPVIFRMLVP